jgi:hypothetical protein
LQTQNRIAVALRMSLDNESAWFSLTWLGQK